MAIYTLTSNSETPGGGVTFTVSGTGVTQAAEGATVTVEGISVEGYYVSSFTSDDVTISTDNTFTMPAVAVTVTANYAAYDDRIKVNGENSPYLLDTGKTYTAQLYPCKDVNDGGGAFYVNMFGVLKGEDVTFKDNAITKGQGGAIRIQNGGTMTISGGSFEGNSGGAGGGAIYNNGTVTFTKGVIFNGNSAEFSGGAIYNNNAKVTIDCDATFTENSLTKTSKQGSAIYNGGTFTINGNATFNGNSGEEGTFAIYNVATITFAGLMDLQTSTDTWYNDIFSTVNWDLTGGKEQYGSVNGFQWYSNKASDKVEQYLLVKAQSGEDKQQTGAYIIASGEGLTDSTLGSNNSKAFKLKAGEDAGQTIDIGGNAVENYQGRNYKLINSGNKYLVLAAYDKQITYSRVNVSAGAPYNINASAGDLFHNISTKGYNGGAMLVDYNGSATGSNLIFISNSTSKSGGALYNCSALTITGTADFIGNSASYYGGAVSTDGSGATFMFDCASTFINNTAGTSGGAVNNNKYSIGTFNGDATFSGNTAAKGGALSNSGTLTFNGDVTISGNTASEEGGAVYNKGKITFSGKTDFSGNVSVADGGFLSNGGEVTFNDDVTFTGNKGLYGGAVANGSTVTFAKSATFTGNKATGTGNAGGAIENFGGTFSFKEAAVFAGNSADNGGAIYNENNIDSEKTGVITFAKGAIFNGNSTNKGNGGAINNAGAEINFAGIMDLQTSTDDWYNAENSTVNWDLTGGLEQYGCITHFEQYSNENNTVKQTITVKAEQATGDYVIATGDLSDVAGKDTFYVTVDGSTFSDALTVGGDMKLFNGLQYTLAVQNTDLVLTIAPNFGVSVDESLVGKWFKAGETVTLTGSYVSETTPDSIKVDGSYAEVNPEAKTWSYTYAVQPVDTQGTDVTITLTAGLEEAGTTYTLKVDKTKPEISVEMTAGTTTYVEGTWTNQNVDVEATFTDVTSGIDGNKSDSQTLTKESKTTDGTTVTFNTKDIAGNEQTKSVVVKIDKTDPVIGGVTVDSFAGDSRYVDGSKVWFRQGDETAVLNVDITDAKSGLKEADFNGVKYDGSKFALATDAAVSAIITAEDNAGNVSKSDAISYYVDGTGPSVSVSHVLDLPDYTLEVTVTADISDGNGSGIATKQYSFDGGETWMDYTGSFTVTENCDITVKAVDNVGNETTVTHSVSNIDSVPPEVTIEADTTKLQNSVSFTVKAEDTFTKVMRFEYSTDGGENWTGLSFTQDRSVTVTLTEDVNNTTWIFRAFDLANNESDHQSVTFNNIYKGTEETFEIIGEKIVTDELPLNAKNIIMVEGSTLTVEEMASVDSENVKLNGNNTIVNNGTVETVALEVSGKGNLISGNVVEASSVIFSEDAELMLDKNQYDSFMANTEFAEDKGKLIVSEISGNLLKVKDINTLMKKKNVSDVVFNQDLLDINRLTFTQTKAASIGFCNGYGTRKNDSIVFRKDTNISFGTAGYVLDLKEGNNSLRLDNNAAVTFQSNVANVSNIRIANSNNVTFSGNVAFADNRNARLQIGRDSAVFADSVNGAEEKSTIISVGCNSSLSVQGNVKTGAMNDQLTINNNCIFIAGNIDMGDGSNRLTINNIAQAEVQNVDGISRLVVASGTKRLETVSATKLTAKVISGTDQNDIFSIGQYADVSLTGLSFGDGNDSLRIGSYSDIEISGLLDFGEGKRDSLYIGRGSTLCADEFDVDSLDKLTMGKDSLLVIADADALAAAQDKWSKYSSQIVSAIA